MKFDSGPSALGGLAGVARDVEGQQANTRTCPLAVMERDEDTDALGNRRSVARAIATVASQPETRKLTATESDAGFATANTGCNTSGA